MGMLQEEHSAILLTSIKLPFVIKIFVLSIFEHLALLHWFYCILKYNESVKQYCIDELQISANSYDEVCNVFSTCKFINKYQHFLGCLICSSLAHCV